MMTKFRNIPFGGIDIMHSGKMIKEALVTSKGTQLSLATAVGCDQSLISRFFSGSIEVSADLLTRMAEHLGMEVIEVLKQLKWDKFTRGIAKLEARYK